MRPLRLPARPCYDDTHSKLMAKSAYDYPSPDVSFRDAARVALGTSLRKMMNNADETRAGLERTVPTADQIEALHDMRVGSRRLRAALSVFARIFPREEFRALEGEVADITDALGGVRDYDVLLDGLREYQKGLPENEAYGIGRLIERQEKLRDAGRRRLLKALDELEESKFKKRFQKSLDRAAPAPVLPVELDPDAPTANAGEEVR